MRGWRGPVTEASEEDRYDLIIIGGGIVGAGIARDASLRGLRVALFEQGDFASGTSGRTSNMIHGGIRYLEQAALRLIFEASRERSILHRLAPHLVRPLPFLFPVYPEGGRPLWMVRAGMTLYDLIALYHNFHSHRILTPRQMLEHEPALSPVGLQGGALFYDAQMDDARLCLEVALSARAGGARLFNYTAVRDFTHRGRSISGVTVASQISGERREVSGSVVVNASGPWLDRVAAREDPSVEPRIRTTRGAHLIVPRMTRTHAIVVSSQSDRRIFFILPFHGESLIGTTDQDYSEEPSSVRATLPEVHYLLEETRRIFPGIPLREDEIIARFAGVRPLVNEPGIAAGSVTREAKIEEGRSGLISVIGGKYTVHRRIAEQVVERVFRKLGRPAPSSVTGTRSLLGGGMPGLEEYQRSEAPGAAREYQVSPRVVAHLIGVYGTRYRAVLERVRADRTLGMPMMEGAPEIMAQVDHAVEEEMAVRLSDFLTRRTRLSQTRHRRDSRMVERSVRRMGELLGWDPGRRQEEIRSYLGELE